MDTFVDKVVSEHHSCILTQAFYVKTMQVPAEANLEPETEAEERQARSEAANPNPQAKTLEEYENEGHKV